jgi:hypothetical protein
LEGSFFAWKGSLLFAWEGSLLFAWEGSPLLAWEGSLLFTPFCLGRLLFCSLPGKAHRFLPGKAHFLFAWEGSPLFAWEGSIFGFLPSHSASLFLHAKYLFLAWLFFFLHRFLLQRLMIFCLGRLIISF